MAKLKLLMLSFVITTYAAEIYATKITYPLVSYKCNPEADIITLTNSLIHSDEGAGYQYSAKKGTYSPWDLVDINNKSMLLSKM